MKKIMGVTVIDGKVVTIEKESWNVICIKDYVDKNSPVMLSNSWATLEFIKGNIYEYVLDQNDDNTISNPHLVYVNGSHSYFNKEKFDEYFMLINEYRNKVIGDLGI